MPVRSRLVAILALLTAIPAVAASQQWEQMPGLARDIGIGHNGGVWIIGTNPAGGGNYGVWSFDGTNWTAVPGGGVRIAVGPARNPWVVTASGEVYARIADEWRKIPGPPMIDIAVGSQGIWAIGADHGLYGLVGPMGATTVNGTWRQRACAAARSGFVRVAAHPNGGAWVIAADDATRDRVVVAGRMVNVGPGSIWRFAGGSNDCYNLADASGHDIGISGNGSVWAIGSPVVGNDYAIYRYQGNQAWLGMPGAAQQISVQGDNNAWVINSNGNIFRWRP